MSAPTGSIFSTQSVRIEEIINKSVEVFLPSYDPAWRDTVLSNQGVGSADEFGRDWKILKVYMGSLTGVVEPGGPRNDFALYGDNQNTALGDKMHTQGLLQTFPSALDGANATPFRLGIPMRSMVANIMLTLGEMQADATDAFIGEVVAPKMEGFARHLSMYLCLYWYLSQNGYYAVSYLDGASGTGWDKTQDTNTTLMVNTQYSNYAVDRFQVGLRYQIYDSTGATLRQTASLGANTVFVCSKVDELTGKVYFKAQDGLALSGAAFADDDIIVFAKSKGTSTTPYSSSPYFTGIAGINSWLKFGTGTDDNYLLGGERDSSNYIDVTKHPEFKSFLYDMAGQPLTEHTLRKLIRRFHAAKHKYGMGIDCLIASDGVWLAYEQQRIGRQYLDRTGRLADISNEGGPGEFIFSHDGKRYTGYTSTFIESGTVYGIKKGGNNWKRYSPPNVAGTRAFDRADSWNPFRFVGAALTGNGSNQLPIYSSSGDRTLVTEGVQMPGWLRMQLVPQQACGMKLINVAEDRTYAAT
jgi:hypothetical protein